MRRGRQWLGSDRPSSGNGWANQALFDFNDGALPALLEFQGKRSYAAVPKGGKQ
jgi:arabinogalactan endo-1,4-beta-galactosidase